MNKTRKDYFWTDYRNNNFIKIKEKKKYFQNYLIHSKIIMKKKMMKRVKLKNDDNKFYNSIYIHSRHFYSYNN